MFIKSKFDLLRALTSLAIAACFLAASTGCLPSSDGDALAAAQASTADADGDGGPKPAPSGAPTPAPPRAGTTVNGLSFTVYYTAVESFHTDGSTPVRGCLDLDCRSSGTIGSYPASFVQAVEDEGTGRITSGAHAGRYLNWSYDVGYWLDTAPRDARGAALIPWVSAAADVEVLAFGVEFGVAACGSGATTAVCSLFKAGHWRINDRFTPGMGGSGHLDLYIGEEDILDFTERSDKYTTTRGSAISVF